jgi:putative transposase
MQNNGVWCCPPGESYARGLGLSYEIRSSKTNKITFLRNIEFLEDYFRSDKSLVAPSIRNIIVSTVKERPGISLDRLLGELAGVEPDQVYSLIATGDLWVDLDHSALREREKVFVYAEEQKSAQPDYQKHSTDPAVGQSINWDGVIWTIVNKGVTNITLVGEDKTFTTIPISIYSELAKSGLIKPGILADDSSKAADLDMLIEQASPESLAEANKHFAIISSYLKGDQIHSHQQSAIRKNYLLLALQIPHSRDALRQWIYRTNS